MRRLSLAGLVAAALAVGGCTQEKTCPSDQRVCGGACVLLATDPQNCGACGRACGAGEACRQGQCTTCAAACGDNQRCVDGMCLADVYAACYDTDEVRAAQLDLSPAGVPLATDGGPISMVQLGDQLYVANSTSNTISAISFDPTATATRGDAAIKVIAGAVGFADLEHIAAHDGLLWISNAAAGTLVAVDPARGVVDEVPLGAPGEFVNPLGVDFVGETAYVALNGANAIAVVDVAAVPGCQPPDPQAPACGAGAACASPATCVNGLCQRSYCGRVVRRIDLSPFAATGANAAPSRVLAIGSRVFVTMWNLFDASYQRVPGAYGRLAVIDTSADPATPSVLDLGPQCLNAYGLALSGSTLWVTCGDYDFTTVRGAAAVPVALGADATATPVVGEPVPLPHAATEIAFCGGSGYVGSSDSGTLMRLDPATATVQTSDLPLCPPPRPGEASYIPSVACAP